jgi:hypothetical protein
MYCDDVEIKDAGVAVFENVVPSDVVSAMLKTIDESGYGETFEGGAASVAQTIFALPRFSRILEKSTNYVDIFASTKFGRPVDLTPLIVHRCVNGMSNHQSHLRHFDSHIVTLIIPLVLSDGDDENGDLIVYKKLRKSTSLVGNFVLKSLLLMMQNLPYPVRKFITYRDLLHGRSERIKFGIGNVYAICGLMNLHANLNVVHGERQTLVIHIGNPKLNVTAGRIAKALRQGIGLAGGWA